MAILLITTDDTDSAGRLERAFQTSDAVRFVSGREDAIGVLRELGDTPAALIVSGGVRQQGVRSLITAVSDEAPHVPIVALIEGGDRVAPDEAAELRLDEVFVKPFDSDEVVLVVHRLIHRKSLQTELGIVGNSSAIQEVVERVSQIAPVGSTVLITGESGTGKELVARGLHRLSPRRGKPFIAVNIAALPETLLESELFGHEKGAFTGANALRKGMFELANGGTMFLDEIAEMPLGPQTRLLRVLEEREFMRVGGSDSIKVDVRVIAATNRDLRQAVETQEFRRDLYYRINVLHIDLPPLRERRADIALLVHEFIREFSREHQREFKGIAPDAMDMLVRYEWPGNVRELRNLIESMVVLAPGGTIRSADIPPEVRRSYGRALPTRLTSAPGVVRSESLTSERLAAAQLPELELIFRTLVDLKFDVEDLRREFEAYKRRHPELTRPVESAAVGRAARPEAADREPQVIEVGAEEGGAGEESSEFGDVITFRPGMSMEEIERAAIVATLKAVGGNRRRASEQLGIGERTLYRKLREYRIDD
ncbi:MAG: sigma-54-dependent Fis family transcriptional regulator [Gemmatimonadota bacterium]|nr:MAG: sigma-54-dependent Fis family transcriptional regulator [Gemmatimonadota bacterium]